MKLTVPKGATQAQVKAAFRRAALTCHPDTSTHPRAAEEFRELVADYNRLMDGAPVEAREERVQLSTVIIGVNARRLPVPRGSKIQAVIPVDSGVTTVLVDLFAEEGNTLYTHRVTGQDSAVDNFQFSFRVPPRWEDGHVVTVANLPFEMQVTLRKGHA